MQDRLGTLVSSLADQLSSAASWTDFVNQVHGRSNLSGNIDSISHPAKRLLADLRDNGVPVILTDEPWSQAHLQQCMDRGAHTSARNNKVFVRDELADYVETGFWTVLPYRLIKDLPNLRLSPLGVKEERERRDRLVVDHTFFGVNEASAPYVPKEAMQFGGALPRILYRVRHSNPAFGPVYLAKFDVSDGFYRLMLRPDDAPSLAVIMPSYEGEEPLVAIPLVCTMGWVNSPPTFCAASETVADLANARLYRHHVPPHRLESIAEEQDE